jgi:ATP-dependent Lon protease
VDGLLKLLYPSKSLAIPDEDIEWAVRLAMECRRRVKEQQKRIGSAEFRNTHFSYVLGEDGIEQFVATPELQSEETIGSDPLPPGQVWAISPGDLDANAGLYRIDVNVGPGSGVKIINVPPPGPFRESMKYAEGNLQTRARELVGDRDPRQHEFVVQLRAFDASKTGPYLGLPALLALCSSLLGKSLKGGLVAVGGLNLGGTLDPVHNAVSVAELAVEKGASTLLIPISARKQLNDLSDEMAMRISVLYYADTREALLKALGD